MDARCRDSSFYLYGGGDHTTLFSVIVYPMIGSCLGVCVLAGVFGLLVYCKKCTPAISLMSSGTVRKLAQIPEVEDKLESVRSKKTVYFKIHQESFKIHRYFSPLFLSTSAILFFAYVSVFIVSQWELTDTCSDMNVVSTTRTCYEFRGMCPPVNCTHWNQYDLKETLMCFSFNPDIFNPLVDFVSLLAVQTVVLQTAAIVINRECCCKARGRFCAIYIWDVVFIAALVVIAITVYTAPGDFETRFVEVSIPLAKLLFVSVGEAAVLGGFLCSLILSKIHEEGRS